MRSIKKRLVKNFMFIIFISVVILEILLISFVKRYYYQNVEDVLTNQIRMSSEFYSRYFSNTSLEDNILDNVDAFWKQTTAQVQIIDPTGKILMDSIGRMPKERLKSVDFQKALKDQKGVWVGNVEYDVSNVMAITYPLKVDHKIVGFLRFITSLREVNNGIRRISFIFLGIGIIVIFISGMVSVFLADSIVGPIKEVTGTAEKMALGNFKVRSQKRFDDEIGKLSDTLNYMADEILKKDQLKNEFISSVSHELRTPLTSIKGWAIILNDNQIKDKEAIREGLKIIEKESERLNTMVEELLDFSKFISQKITLNKEEIKLASLVDYIEHYITPRALRENIEFIVEYEKDSSLFYADKNRIKQVLINVLDNAFKFTPKDGSVIFSIQKNKEDIVIVIRDNGCGISSEDLPKVKEKFYKGKNSKSQNGIGLSICDEIIKMHGGVLKIKSALDKGTTVFIKIPIGNDHSDLGEVK